MSLFHQTLRDAEKLFETNPKKAIRILEKHQKLAEEIHMEIAKIKIEASLEEYSSCIGELISSLKKSDTRNAHSWIDYLEGKLVIVNRGIKKLEKYVLLK